MEKEEVNKDRPDSECLWALGKKCKERKFAEPVKFLLLVNLDLLFQVPILLLRVFFNTVMDIFFFLR